MRGADALIRALERAGVDTVFGIPGGACLPIYDALHDSPIRHVLMRHEAAAGHAAEGYARASGRIGVAIATSGPGATNLVTAIADAQMDSTPTLFITGQVKTALRGTNAFQEADVIGITQPLVKHSIAIERADDVAQAVVDALRIATSGRPGPVLIDLPVDIANAPARDETHAPYLPGYRPRERPNGRQVRARGGGARDREPARALRRRRRRQRGRGARSCARSRTLSGAPVTTTLMALGAFPASDDRVARDARHARDAGRELGDGRGRPDRRHRRPLRRPRDRRVDEFARDAKIVHIDVDPSEIGKIVAVHVPVVGDAKLALGRAQRRLREAGRRRDAAGGVVAPHPRLAGRAPAARARAGRATAASRPSSRSTRSPPRSATRSSPPTSASTRCGRPAGCGFEAAAPLDHLRRARDDGLRPARPRSARRPRARTRPSSASPARARS